MPINNAINLNTPLASFLTYYTSSPSAITGDGTEVTLAFDGILHDSTSSVSSGTYTVPYTATYMVGASILCAGLDNTLHNIGRLAIGTATDLRYCPIYNIGNLCTPTGEYTLSSSFLMDLTVGDILSVKISVDGTSKDVYPLGGASTILYSYFYGFQLI